MTRAEAISVVEYMAELWGGNWKPTPAEMDAWVRLLAPFSYETAKEAAYRCWKEKNFGKPLPEKIIAAARSLSAPVSVVRSNFGATDVWVQCVAAPARFPGRSGWFLPVHATGSGGKPLPRERLLDVAERMRAGHERLYRGRWVVVSDTDERAMILERSRLRCASAPDDPPGQGLEDSPERC